MGDWYGIEGASNRVGSGCAILDDKVYLIGGKSSSSENDSPWLQIDCMSLPNMEWQSLMVNNTLGSLNRVYHATAAINKGKKVMVFGGQSAMITAASPDQPAHQAGILSEITEIITQSPFGVQVLSHKANANANTADCVNVKGLTACVIGPVEDEKVVLFGGQNAQSQCLNELNLFSPLTPFCSTEAETGAGLVEEYFLPLTIDPESPFQDIPCARVHHTCVIGGRKKNKLLLYGGQNEKGELLNDLWMCDLGAVVETLELRYAQQARKREKEGARKAAAAAAASDGGGEAAEGGEEEEKGEEEEEEEISLVTTMSWKCLLSNSEIGKGRYLHSSFSYMKPIVEGAEEDTLLYLSILGGLTTSGNDSSSNEVLTASINLTPEEREADEEGNGACDGTPMAIDFTASSTITPLQPSSSLTSLQGNGNDESAKIGCFMNCAIDCITTSFQPCGMVLLFDGNDGYMSVCDDSIEMALQCKKNRIKKIKEAKALLAATLKAEGGTEVEEEPSVDASGLPKKVQYPNGDVYEGDLKLPENYIEGDPIVPVTLVRTGKGKMSYSGTDENNKNNIAGDIYTGIWLNGDRHGYGILINEIKNTKYEGQWVDDKQHGPGTLSKLITLTEQREKEALEKEKEEEASQTSKKSSKSKSSKNKPGSALEEGNESIIDDNDNDNVEISEAEFIYDGEWRGGLYSGEGILHYDNNSVYTGSFLDGKRHGKGSLKPRVDATGAPVMLIVLTSNNDENENNFTYDGDWIHDNVSGEGVISNMSIQSHYSADVPNNKMKDTEEGLYNGPVRNGIPWGKKGHCRFANGCEYLGEWINGKRSGYGKIVFPNCDEYEGKFVGNIRTGYGVLKSKDGCLYQGQWKDNQYHGKGTFMSSSGKIVEGKFVFGKIEQ